MGPMRDRLGTDEGPMRVGLPPLADLWASRLPPGAVRGADRADRQGKAKGAWGGRPLESKPSTRPARASDGAELRVVFLGEGEQGVALGLESNVAPWRTSGSRALDPASRSPRQPPERVVASCRRRCFAVPLGAPPWGRGLRGSASVGGGYPAPGTEGHLSKAPPVQASGRRVRGGEEPCRPAGWQTRV